MSQLLREHTVILGCDPEFFFLKGAKVQGSEKILPQEGLTASIYGTKSSIIIDGVQAELNPAPNTCRASLATSIGVCLEVLKERLMQQKDITVSFGQTYKVSKRELDELSEKAKVLGCAPSNNAYKDAPRITIKKAQNVRIRSGGGHIHFGSLDTLALEVLKTPEKLVPLLDLVLGNTCVLIDRDPGNTVRRRYYGRAGEYRSPHHGLEYRVLSNFWMRNHALMSFVFGLARQTIWIATNSGFRRNYADELMSRVRRTDVKRAINKNDADLARKNFDAIAPLLAEWFGSVNANGIHTYHRTPLTKDSIPLFLHFAEKGMDYWFKDDPFTHWTTLTTKNHPGWGIFLEREIKPDSTNSKKTYEH